MKILTIILLIAFSFFSCKKNENKNSTCTSDAASISGSYKITAYTYKASATSPEVDYYNTLFPDACDRDNVLRFDVNGTYKLIDAGMVCSPPGDDNGTWTVSGNTMTVDGEATGIKSFDCKTLILSDNDFQTPGDELKITLTKQ